MYCRGDQHWHPQYHLEKDPSLAPKLIRSSRLGDSHGQHSDISRTRAKWALPTAMTRAVELQIGQTRGWRRYHIRTSKPVMRLDEGMSFSCFARDILTARDPVKEVWETTRRSPQKEERTFGGVRNLPWEVTHIHQAELLLHGCHTDGLFTRTVATLQHTVGCRTADLRKSPRWCTRTAPSGAYCGRETPSDEGGHRQHQRPGGGGGGPQTESKPVYKKKTLGPYQV